MTDFTRVDREYDRLPALLVDNAPGFAESEEYARLDPNDLELPTVVCGAFNRYFCRLQNAAAMRPELDPTVARALRDAYRAIDRLCASNDPEVVNTVVVEIFEHLDLGDATLATFEARRGKTARELYDRWNVEPAR